MACPTTAAWSVCLLPCGCMEGIPAGRSSRSRIFWHRWYRWDWVRVVWGILLTVNYGAVRPIYPGEWCSRLLTTCRVTRPCCTNSIFEGLVFFAILWLFSRKSRPTMAVSGLYLICYGVFRFAIEFFRVPDAHIGYLAFDWLTMGQLLSLPMIVIGIAFFIYAYRRTDGKVSW